MIFLKCWAASSPARLGRVALTALGLVIGGAALGTLPMIGVAHADHGQGGGHDGGGHDAHDNGGADHSGPGRGADSHDNRGPGHDDAVGHDANDDDGADDPADHDVNDDKGGLEAGGADDPADHDANDDKGTDGTVIPTTAN